MEVLAVLMIVALIASMAVPVFRYVRREMRYNQTRAAATKMADALRSYYQETKGRYITQECFTGDTDTNVVLATSCDDVSKSGIPGSYSGTGAVSQLFACGYLNFRDFAGLPYTFCVCNPNGASSACDNASGLFVRVTGTDNAGDAYKNRVITVDKKMLMVETD